MEEIMNLLSYDEVTKKIQQKRIKTKHLILGNGFSISYDKNIFSYDALNTFIEDTQSDLVRKIFKLTNTRN